MTLKSVNWKFNGSPQVVKRLISILLVMYLTSECGTGFSVMVYCGLGPLALAMQAVWACKNLQKPAPVVD